MNRNFRRETNVARDEKGNITVQTGDTFHWNTIGGEKFTGIIKEIDSNVLIVQLPNGTTKGVEI